MNPKAYLIGGGIASLASAVYLIKDGNIAGKDIFIFEESGLLGGSLDAQGTAKTGYLARGGRIFSEEVYTCTLNLLSQIPVEKSLSRTLLDDFIEFNKGIKTKAKARLVRGRKIIDSSIILSLSVSDGTKLLEIMVLPEFYLGESKISDHFSPAFFETNFWLEWCTTLAFQPWHSTVEFKRYLLRFIQEFPRTNTMTGVRHTRYNQYESIVLPITNWLKNKGVNFILKSRVADLKFVKNGNKEQVKKIIYFQNEKSKKLSLGTDDLVFLTNGSMTTNSTFGRMKSAPVLNRETPRDSWALWKKIAKNRPHFGQPAIFCSQINKTKWESFTVTLGDKIFFNLMKIFSKNKPGTGGLTTITDSNWLLTIVIPPQPHFINQPEEIGVFWGYGLFPDKKGNYIDKKMSDCTGEEILIEVCSHFGFIKELPKILKTANCIPCLMPYITSQFMPRKEGDRPKVIPKGTKNFAFIGQFCELPHEIVFTVEQSVRTAMMAVYGLLNLKKEIPPIYHGQHNLGVLKKLLKMGFDFGLTKFIPNHKTK